MNALKVTIHSVALPLFPDYLRIERAFEKSINTYCDIIGTGFGLSLVST